MTHFTKTFGAVALGLAFAAPASANPANVDRVTEGLIITGMAYELSEECGNVNARMIRGLNYLMGLKRHLEDLGYSDAEIDAFIDNDVEKDRLEGIARQRLADLGVRTGDEASYCAVARAQMAADTPVGRLLR